VFRLGFLRLMRNDAAGAPRSARAVAWATGPDWLEAQVNLGLALKQIRRKTKRAAGCFEAGLEDQADSVESAAGLAALAIDKQDPSACSG